MIPTIERLVRKAQHNSNSREIACLVISPTRELAQQIAEEIDALSVHRPVSTAVLVGGLPMPPQERALKKGAAIVVGTPGRVLDHWRRKNLDLSDCTIACLDEADEMVSMGFYEDVTKILSKTKDDRQVLLFSATISKDTARLVRQFLKDPEDIILSTDEDKVEGIDHICYEAPAGTPKQRALMYVIDAEDPDAAIIFCNTRQDTSTVAAYLERQGMDVIMISGELPQSRRSEVMRRVKAGEVRFLVATDVAARGIDISDLTHVFNYSLPQDAKVYLHRIGRTGRAGKDGVAISLISGTDMGTRRVLESVHAIDFTERPFPDEIEAVRKRVDRQARRIRGAMGHMVFESYLPTVRALKERDDCDLLLAVALKGFFTWDRQRRAALLDVDEPDRSSGEGPQADASEDDGRKKRRRKGKKDDRDDRSDRGRDDRRERKSRSRKDDDGDRKPRKKKHDADDLDALLEVGGGGDLDALLEVGGEPADKADDGPKKKKRSKKKSKKDEPKRKAAAKDELDEILEVDSVLDVEDVPEPDADIDDLDALLSAD